MEPKKLSYKHAWMKKWRDAHPKERKELARKYAKTQRLKPDHYKKMAKLISLWRIRNPEKVKAHRAVYVALRNKSLIRGVCHCGATKAEAHHADYSKPLEVEWLCKKHHIEADEARRKLSTEQSPVYS